MTTKAAGSLAVASALALAAYAAAPGGVAHACSAGPDWNPVTQSELIVQGVIEGWEPVEVDGFPGEAHVRPIRVEMTVEETLKGQAPVNFSFVDTGSLANIPEADPPMWWGSSGACGAFDADPTGAYVLMGLSQDDTGTWRSNLLTTFYVGEKSGFESFWSSEAAARLAGYGLRLPATGQGATAGASSPDQSLMIAASLLIAFGVGGLGILRSTE